MKVPIYKQILQALFGLLTIICGVILLAKAGIGIMTWFRGLLL